MKKLINSLTIIISLSFFITCSNSQNLIIPVSSNFNELKFDVVSKNLIFQENVNPNIISLTSNWFDRFIKLDGFDGNLDLLIYDYLEVISDIDNGKRIETSFKFTLNITKNQSSFNKVIEGKVSSFGKITGDFSLNDFDDLIINTQIELINRLASDLKSKT